MNIKQEVTTMVGNTTRENPPADAPPATASGGSQKLGKMGGGAAQGDTKDVAHKRRLHLAFLSAEATEAVKKAVAEATKEMTEKVAKAQDEAKEKFDAAVKKFDEEAAKEAEAAAKAA